MPTQVGPIASDQDLDINITGLTPHVIAYTMWGRGARDSEWQQFAAGDTGDNQPDHCRLSARPGAQIWYWIGISNPHRPNTPYNVLITLGQGGKRLSGGSLLVRGKTDGSGQNVVEDWINLI